MSTDIVIKEPFVVGEIPDPLEYQFLDGNGAPMPLAGYSAKFSTRLVEGSVPIVNNAAATISDAPNGKVTYAWTGAEFPYPGKYYAEFWIGNGTQRYASVRIKFTVRSTVSTAAPTI